MIFNAVMKIKYKMMTYGRLLVYNKHSRKIATLRLPICWEDMLLLTHLLTLCSCRKGTWAWEPGWLQRSCLTPQMDEQSRGLPHVPGYLIHGAAPDLTGHGGTQDRQEWCFNPPPYPSMSLYFNPEEYTNLLYQTPSSSGAQLIAPFHREGNYDSEERISHLKSPCNEKQSLIFHPSVCLWHSQMTGRPWKGPQTGWTLLTPAHTPLGPIHNHSLVPVTAQSKFFSCSWH